MYIFIYIYILAALRAADAYTQTNITIWASIDLLLQDVPFGVGKNVKLKVKYSS